MAKPLREGLHLLVVGRDRGDILVAELRDLRVTRSARKTRSWLMNGMRRLHVTFTLRRENTLTRVISARDMSVKERAVYDEIA